MVFTGSFQVFPGKPANGPVQIVVAVRFGLVQLLIADKGCVRIDKEDRKSVFTVGDIVRHPKFGEGVVIRRVASRLRVDFDGETKLLITRARRA